MGTKWRSFRTNKVTKMVTFVLAVISLSAAVLVFQLSRLQGIDFRCLSDKNYLDSDAVTEDINDEINILMDAIKNGQEPEEVSYLYYLNNGRKKISNTDQQDLGFFKNAGDVYISFENGNRSIGSKGPVLEFNEYIPRAYKGYFAFPKEYFTQKQYHWDLGRERLIKFFGIAAALTVIGLLLFILVIAVTGRSGRDRELHLRKLDKVYSDIILLTIALFLWFLISRVKSIFSDESQIGFRINFDNDIIVYTDFNGQFLPSVIFFITLFSAMLTVILILFLSLVRKYKAGILLKHNFLYKICIKLYRVFSDIYKYLFYGDLFRGAPPTKTLYYRQLILVISVTTMLVLGLGFAYLENPLYLFPMVLGIAVSFWYTVGNKKIYNDIENNIQLSMSEQLKAERMKIALITNVSHDLKTPLTSIISYVDLLSKEEGLTETADDYIKILQAKSERLKNIVTDLFELAKSTSGDVTLDYDELDLKRLMEQMLAEMDDKITASGLQFKMNLPETQVTVKTDGKRLYRVFQNVIDNAIKYSMKGTRVYVDLEAKNGKALATIKNIANYEMDFTSEDILQRFVRGDQARTEDGSGLGLSIAESFTKVSGGDFEVEIDGDLFKAMISFPMV